MAHSNTVKNSSTMSKTDDGTINLILHIPYSEVKKHKAEAVDHLSHDVTVPGFRKGKAPRDKAEKHISPEDITEHAMKHILPNAFQKAIKKHKVAPVIFPRFRILNAEDGKDWQIQASTCEVPEPDISNIEKALKAKSGSKSKTKKVVKEKAQKEQEVLDTIAKETQITIPDILMEQEIENRLSDLLSRLEKLNITLEGYLSSIGKSIEQVREEYKKQASGNITLELALNKIADKKDITAANKDIDSAIQASGTPDADQSLNTPEQRQVIKGILTRRKALDALAALV